MSFDNCCTCGYEFTKKDRDVPYADGGFNEVNHGGGQCRECYIRNGHPLCGNGHINYTSSKFCYECGVSLEKKENMKLPENGKTVVRTDVTCSNCFLDLNIRNLKFMLVTFDENKVAEVCPVCKNGRQCKRKEYLDSNSGFTFVYRRLPFDGNLGPTKSKISKEQLEKEFTVGQSLQQIGDKYHLSRERVRQLGIKYGLKKQRVYQGKKREKCNGCELEFELTKLKDGKCFKCRAWVWVNCEVCKNNFLMRTSNYRGGLGPSRKAKRKLVNIFFCNKKCYGVYFGKKHGFGARPKNVARGKREKHNIFD